MSHEHESGHSESTAYETRDVKVRPLVQFLVGLTIATIAAYLIVLGVFRLFNAKKAAEDSKADPVAVERAAKPDDQKLPAEPRIQADPAGDLQALRKVEDRILTTYGWIDRSAGTVHIPIEQAMQRVLAEGLPVRASGSAPPAQAAAVKK